MAELFTNENVQLTDGAGKCGRLLVREANSGAIVCNRTAYGWSTISGDQFLRCPEHGGSRKPLPLQSELNASNKMTVTEISVLENLCNAWNEFLKIPSLRDDVMEFKDSIHRCQQILALQVARRVEPERWRQPNDGKTREPL